MEMTPTDIIKYVHNILICIFSITRKRLWKQFVLRLHPRNDIMTGTDDELICPDKNIAIVIITSVMITNQDYVVWTFYGAESILQEFSGKR